MIQDYFQYHELNNKNQSSYITYKLFQQKQALQHRNKIVQDFKYRKYKHVTNDPAERRDTAFFIEFINRNSVSKTGRNYS